MMRRVWSQIRLKPRPPCVIVLLLEMVMATEHKLSFHVLSNSMDGVVKVTRARWSEIVYRFPRTVLKDATAVEELQGSGIYFLLGEKDGQPTLYIGQAQDIQRRLMQHSVSENKSFWTRTLALTSTGDAVFNNAHLNYLERRFHDLASEAGRMNVENSMPPSVGCGIATIQQEMDECISHTVVLLNLMGYDFLEKQPDPLPQKPEPSATPAVAEDSSVRLLYCTVADADAVGCLNDDGSITVLKGSRICAVTKGSCSPSAAVLRAEAGESHITQKDYTFKSLSSAACFVGGCQLNGKLYWTETPKPGKK